MQKELVIWFSFYLGVVLGGDVDALFGRYDEDFTSHHPDLLCT